MARRVIAWLFLFALPLHGLTVIYVGFWGPPHFHLEEDDHDHSHGPGHVERHHHPADDATVVAVDDPATLDTHALEEGPLTAWSGAVYPAMISTALLIARETGNAIAPAPAAALHTRFPGPLERPPRPASS